MDTYCLSLMGIAVGVVSASSDSNCKDPVVNCIYEDSSTGGVSVDTYKGEPNVHLSKLPVIARFILNADGAVVLI